jgi:osmotically-inducible protein OsmY
MRHLKKITLGLCLAIVVALTGPIGCAGNRYEQSTGEYIDDAAITARVKDALGEDAQFKFDDVDVSTFKRTVQLSGFVQSNAQRARAAAVAEAVGGVEEVDNKITVKE